MNKKTALLILALLLLAGCSADAEEATSNNTRESAPTEQLIRTEDLVGTWWGKGSAYQRFTADGALYVASTRGELTSAPVVTARYWFEDSQVYLQEVEGSSCSADTVGVYKVWRLENNNVRFDVVEDSCANRVRAIEGNRAGEAAFVVEWQRLADE